MRVFSLVPRDLFNKMAILAFVAILLAAALSLEAFAAEDDFHDSGSPVNEETETPPDFPIEEIPDNFSEDDPLIDPSAELLEDDQNGRENQV